MNYLAAALGGFLSGMACAFLLVVAYAWWHAPLSHRSSTISPRKT